MRDSPAFSEGAPTESAGESTLERTVAPELAVGDQVGRYVVLSKLGAGGMGVVHAAYDPQLDRKVALKLLRSPAAAASTPAVRMLREAQALARLAHPNVVAIHDVGVHEDAVWLAMEFLDGHTLTAWLRREPRSWREILDVMLQAGQGLAAAHAVGLVHRDFKPDNVMVASDGRVRVMDFGLARASGSEEVVEVPAIPSDSSALTHEVTRAGVFVGTPGYMAPEQWHGEGVDARSDQFGYCVTLYEALYGQRPFKGQTAQELAAHVIDGDVLPPPRGAKVPSWLHRVVVRGLAADQSRRWSSMAELLAALSRDPARRRRRMLQVGAVAAAAAGVWGWQVLAKRRAIAACDDEGTRVDEVWNDAARARVRSAIGESGVLDPEGTWARVEPWLDRHAGQWHDVTRGACVARIDDPDPKSHALATECLDERLVELGVLVDVLAESDRRIANESVQLAASLAPIAACVDERRLVHRTALPEDADRREQARTLRRAMTHARLTVEPGRAEQARQILTDIGASAEALGHPPLVAEADWLGASLLVRLGDWEGARAAAERAFVAATELGDDELAVRAGALLVLVEGVYLAHEESGVRWGRIAQAVLARIGDDDSLLAAELWSKLGQLDASHGREAEGRASIERALAIRERVLGSEHPDVTLELGGLARAHITTDPRAAIDIYRRVLTRQEATLSPDDPAVAATLNNLGKAHAALGETEQALAMFERSLAVSERAYDANHPNVATSLHNLGVMYSALGRTTEALDMIERALAMRRASLGEHHVQVGESLQAVGTMFLDLGRLAEARDALERALLVFDAAGAPDAPVVAATLNTLGQLDRVEGRWKDALARHRSALAVQEKKLGPDHPDLAYSYYNIGMAMITSSEYAEALPPLERALGLWQSAMGDESPMLTHPWTSIGRARLELGRAKDALEPLEKALKVRERGDATPSELAETQYLLARAIEDSGGSRTRAHELAESALGHYERAEGQHAEAIAELRAWLRVHPLP